MIDDEDEVTRLRKRIAVLQAELADYDALFELQHKRQGEADAAWRAAHPGNELVLPDLGDLLSWLLKEREEMRAALARTNERDFPNA